MKLGGKRTHDPGIGHMGLTVSELESSLYYYQKNLGSKVLDDGDRLPSICSLWFFSLKIGKIAHAYQDDE